MPTDPSALHGRHTPQVVWRLDELQTDPSAEVPTDPSACMGGIHLKRLGGNSLISLKLRNALTTCGDTGRAKNHRPRSNRLRRWSCQGCRLKCGLSTTDLGLTGCIGGPARVHVLGFPARLVPALRGLVRTGGCLGEQPCASATKARLTPMLLQAATACGREIGPPRACQFKH